PGPAPLRLDARTPAWAVPPVPLDSFAPFEFGMFPPRQPAQGLAWSVASTARDRPAEQREASGLEVVHQEQCAELAMTQPAAAWLAPRGGLTSWQRADEVWASTRDGTARRVRRVVQQRDGIAREPAVRVEVQYELKDRGRLIGRTYDRYRVEVETAFVAAAEL